MPARFWLGMAQMFAAAAAAVLLFSTGLSAATLTTTALTTGCTILSRILYPVDRRSAFGSRRLRSSFERRTRGS